MQTEFDDAQSFEPYQAATSAVFALIEGSYNRQRLHSAIGDSSPDDMERIVAAA